MATQRRLGVRLGIEGEESVRAALAGLGRDGQRALRDLEEAGEGASRGLISIDRAAGLAKNAVAGLAAGFGLAQVAGFVRETIETGRQLDLMARKTGESATVLSEYEHVARRVGVSLDGLADVFKDMQERISEAASEGGGEGKEALDELGLSAERLINLKPSEAFEEIAEAISQLGNESDQNRLTVKLFADAGYELLPAMQGGAAGIRAAREEAKALGVALSTDAIGQLREASDSFIRLDAAVEGVQRQIGVAIAGPFADLGSWLDTNMPRFVQLAEKAYRLSTIPSAIKLGESTFKALDVLEAKRLEELPAQIDAATAAFERLREQQIRGDFSGPMRKFDRTVRDARDSLQELEQEFEELSARAPVTVVATDPAGTGPPGTTPPDRPPGPSLAAIENATKLNQEYLSLRDSLLEQIALFGAVGEAAKLRYTVEKGALEALSQPRKDELIGLGAQLDALKNDGLIDALNEELALTRLGARERAIEAQLRKLSADATDEQRAAVIRLAGGLHDASTAAVAVTEAASPFAVEWGRAVESVTDTVARGLVDGFENTADAVRGIFRNLLADLIRLALTNPVRIGATVGLSGTAGTAAASTGGDLLSLGGQSLLGLGTGYVASGLAGAFAGTSFGLGAANTAGILTAGGAGLDVLNSAAGFLGSGSVLGAAGAVAPYLLPILSAFALTSLLKGKPSDKAQGIELDFLADTATQTGALSGSKFDQKNRDVADAFGSQVQGLVGSLESLTGTDFTSSIGLKVGSRDGLRGRIGEDIFTGTDPEAFLDQFFDAVVDRFDTLGETFRTLLKNTDPDEVVAMAASLAQLNQFMDADLMADYSEATRLANRSLVEVFEDQRGELARLTADFDGSAQAALGLSSATQTFGVTALQVLAQIDAARASVGRNADDFVRSIELATRSADEQYSFLKAEADALAEQIAGASDPAEIERLQQAWFRSAGQAFGLVDEERRGAVGSEFINATRDLEQLAAGRLDAVESRVDSVVGGVQGAIETAMDRAATEIAAAVVAALTAPAADLNRASDTILTAADSWRVAAATPIRIALEGANDETWLRR